VSKAFDDCRVLHHIDLVMEREKRVALLGPSGCGKTTLLRLLAGFEWPDTGTITIHGRMVIGGGHRVAAEDRRVGMVFQEYALFPHLNVAANVAFGLRGTAQAKQRRVAEMLALVGLGDLGERMPHELSGGQQQRVALARALAPSPDILLLDEPFSNLDAALRAQVRTEVRSILREMGTSCLFVTHDQEEALSFADKVAVLLSGRIVQSATPRTLYQQPVSREVAMFVGEASFLPGQAEGDTVSCALGQLPILFTEPTVQRLIYGPVDVLIRPEMLSLNKDTHATHSRIAYVNWIEYYGYTQRIGLVLDNGTALVARLDAKATFSPGNQVTVSVVSPVLVFPNS
jgi:iron(III) transport system ATP-binding protein